ncbi:major facilitator superfamily domain-containing protein [Microdochium trichocladiopsis]|uniref:Major facilitator superfamily domain-containing protein n=1 Tax=Microdochium trichocladiopsis TaxID=1682393 RepID=A0A9P8Y8U5_9PEZI|nr:major facilitator superfamily domain-containing protein [Microdochium trichocladiopsis]KAH7032671.1 major facilitator superfamily domain-containing protein [Microdochium trichocladiopsis]
MASGKKDDHASRLDTTVHGMTDTKQEPSPARHEVVAVAEGSSGTRDGDVPEAECEEVPMTRLCLITFALSLAGLLTALDATMLASGPGPALPAITSDFQALDHIGWYTSVFLLAQMPFQLAFGRLITFYEPKLFNMVALAGFEVGTVLCATAPSSAVFILGRAISGLGAAGMMAGAFAIIGHIPIRRRPQLISLFFIVQSVAYTAGPSMAGALTDSYLTWRFSFWLQLPLGFVAVTTLFFVLEPKPSPKGHLPMWTKLSSCDLAGTGLLVSCLALFFLALEWGGAARSYAAPQVWGCLLGSGLLAVAFVSLQVAKKDSGLVPLHLARQRTVACCCIFSALYGAANMIHFTLLPTYLQTVHDISATLSGVYQLPITLSNITSMALASTVITKYGHYLPFLRAGPLIYLVGAVLFQQMRVTSTAAWYLSAEISIGAGFGLAVHSSLLAVQVVCTGDDIPVAAVMEVFSQQLGRSVGISIAQSVFVQALQGGLADIAAASPPIASEQVLGLAGQGLEEMVRTMQAVEPAVRAAVKQALNSAVATAYILPVAATAGAAVVVWVVENRTIDVSKKAAADVPADRGGETALMQNGGKKAARSADLAASGNSQYRSGPGDRDLGGQGPRDGCIAVPGDAMDA